jgi:hypothetical protein
MILLSIGVILRPNTSRKIRSMGVSSKGLRRATDPYTTSGEGGTEFVFFGVADPVPCPDIAHRTKRLEARYTTQEGAFLEFPRS